MAFLSTHTVYKFYKRGGGGGGGGGGLHVPSVKRVLLVCPSESEKGGP